MTRIAELQKKYPGIHKDIVVKWEVLNRGVRDNTDLDMVSEWLRRGGIGTYQSYDLDVTLKEVVGKHANRVKPGRMLRPRDICLKSGLGAKVQLSSNSPYQIRDRDDGQFGLFEGEELVDVDIYFPPRPDREEAVTSKGTPVSDLVPLNRSCFAIIPIRHCEYFTTGDQCKFCNFNVSEQDAKTIGVSRAVTTNLEETVEAYKIQSSRIKLVEGRFESGGLMNSENEGRIYFDFVEKIASAAPYKPNLKINTQAMGRKDLQRLKDAGLDCMAIQLEVWEERLFAEILPGKAKHCSYQAWLESMQDAVDILGVGNVGGKIIGGLSLIPNDGHRTWQEARDSHIEGDTWMIKNGIYPTFSVLRLPPGSVYAEDPSNRDRRPPTEYYLEVAQAHHEAMKEYGLYEKLNRLLYCCFCCSVNVYTADLGIIEMAGDVGNWMSEVVPLEDNWVAQFLSTLEGSATLSGAK